MEATGLGIPGSDHLWDDLGPAGSEALVEIARRHRQAVSEHLDHPDSDQRHAAEVLDGFLGLAVDHYDSDDYLFDLGHTYCGFTRLRDIFDIMPRDTAVAWSNITARLGSIGEPLAGWRSTLAKGIAEGKVVARRQVQSIIEQAENMAGDDSMVVGLVEEASAGGHATADLERAAAEARRQSGDLADWLRTEYLPHAPSEDGVGEERYLRSAERFLGMVIGPREVYSWGWEEVERLRSELARVAADVDADLTVDEVIELMDTDPLRAVPRDRFTAFVQERLEQAVTDLDGSHFEVPEPARRVTANLAPAGGSLGAWYINPSVDWERPGSVWYALGEGDAIPVWQEVSTAYHEGFPGHHLQIATSMYQADRLSKAHRLLIWYSGYGEGWALYAERLMDELGYFELPEYRMGMLASQLFRAVRVVVDIGCHLGYRIPEDAPLHPGESWSFEVAVDYIDRIGLQPRDVSESEVKRYLGWPGQAISYKVGEREIIDIRNQLEKAGSRFDLKEFHRRVLEGGELRLDHLRRRMLS